MTVHVSRLRLATAIILFIIGSWMFGRIDSCHYIDRKKAPHIIDVHLMPDSTTKTWQTYSTRFFDSAYVRMAAKAYSPSRYMATYYMLDFCYPFIYAFLFLSLISGFKGTRFHKIMRVVIVACSVFDLCENTSFAYFLFHQSGTANRVVAFCTTIKSILYFLCILVSAITFLIWLFKRLNATKKNPGQTIFTK